MNANRVNMINMADAGRLNRGYYLFDATECPVIIYCMRPAKLIPFLQMSQFDPQNRRLDSIHPAIPSDLCMVVFANLPVVAKDPNLLIQLSIPGHNGASLAECAEILAGVEAETGRVAKCADPSSFVLRTMRLGGVFNDKQ